MRAWVLLVVSLLTSSLAHPTTVFAQVPRTLGMTELIAAADERNPTITAARQAVLVAEANIAVARSGRGPTVSATGSVGQSGGGTTTSTSGFSSSAGISTSYVIHDAGQTALAVRQAEANLRSARLALEVARQDVAQTVGLGFISVLRADRAVAQREQVVRQNQELVRVAEGQFRAGVVARADVVRAQAGLAAAEGELIAARNGVDQARASLNTAIGFAPTAPLVVAAAPPVVPQVRVAAADLVGLVEQRAEVRRAQADVEAAEVALALAQVGNGLRVTLNGGVTQPFTGTGSTSYSVTSTISLPVSDAGRLQANVAAATANLAAARARVEAARLNAQQQAVAALLGIQNARARITSARAGLAFAQESLRLAQGRFAAGAGPLLEVTDAQTVLVQAEVALATAEYDEAAGIISLRYALGRSVIDGAL